MTEKTTSHQGAAPTGNTNARGRRNAARTVTPPRPPGPAWHYQAKRALALAGPQFDRENFGRDGKGGFVIGWASVHVGVPSDPFKVADPARPFVVKLGDRVVTCRTTAEARAVVSAHTANLNNEARARRLAGTLAGRPAR